MKAVQFIFFVLVFCQIIGTAIISMKLVVDAIEWIGERTGLWAALNRIDDERIANERKLGWHN